MPIERLSGFRRGTGASTHCRAMQSYDATFAQGGANSSIILSPDNAYLRQFRGGNR